MVRTVFSVILGCGCHLRHTTSEGCDVHGKCLCKENYDSKTCGRCKLGYVDFPTCRKLGKKKRLITASILSFPKHYHAPVSYKDKYLKSITVFFESRACKGINLSIHFKFRILACSCPSAGSQSIECNTAGQCDCKEGYTGPKCDRCKNGYYGYPECKGK